MEDDRMKIPSEHKKFPIDKVTVSKIILEKN